MPIISPVKLPIPVIIVASYGAGVYLRTYPVLGGMVMSGMVTQVVFVIWGIETSLPPVSVSNVPPGRYSFLVYVSGSDVSSSVRPLKYVTPSSFKKYSYL